MGLLVLPVTPGVQADGKAQTGPRLLQEAHNLVHHLLLGVLEERGGHVLLEGRQVLRHKTLRLVVLVPPLKTAIGITLQTSPFNKQRCQRISSTMHFIFLGKALQSCRST